MGKSKFDLNNLPNLKIRVATTEESERVILAFELLGFRVKHIGNKRPFLFFADDDKVLDYVETEMAFNVDWGNNCQEITLPELEALAAEKRLQSCKEKPLEMGNMPGNTTPTVVTYMKVQAYAEGDCDNCGCGVALKVDVTKEAQKRYDAAFDVLKAASVDYGVPLLSFHQKALRIASGLEPIQPQDNQKQ